MSDHTLGNVRNTAATNCNPHSPTTDGDPPSPYGLVQQMHPGDSRVHRHTSRVQRLTYKVDSTMAQINFLKTLRREHLLPKHLATLHLPSVFNRNPMSDTTGPLEDLDAEATQRYCKGKRKHERKIHILKRYLLKAEVADKYLTHRIQKQQLKFATADLAAALTATQFNTIMRSVGIERRRTREELHRRHQRKLEDARVRVTVGDTPPPPPPNTASPSPPPPVF